MEHQRIRIDRPYSWVRVALLRYLQERGLHTRRTFCLSEARAQQGAQVPCPHHGHRPCTCEWCTYLVYDENDALVATLTLYGNEKHTYITWRDEERSLNLPLHLWQHRQTLDPFG